MSSTSLHSFDIHALLSKHRIGEKVTCFSRKQLIFSHGDRSDSIFYIQKGIVKLTVISKQGREAIIGLLDAGDLFGESCLASDQPVRFHNAVALTDVYVIKIDRKIMIRVLLEGGDTVYTFVNYLLKRNAQIQQDLVNTLLSSSEERLARVLLLFTQASEDKEKHVLKLTQQTLAEMIGTTRQRVNVLMKRFKKLGLIEDQHLEVNGDSLRDIALGDYKSRITE